ncbi:MAG TPA: homocysteine S-methyltransferase family protein [Anaerolineaceae bacterium]|nr:homocysteine S-methyltransferase family protein [Anaerolineaceae bacterium]
MSKAPFLERVRHGERLVADGAMGTNLQAMGLPRGTPAEIFLIDHPEAIASIHRRFIEGGSDVILTCSFGGSPIRLEHTGLKGRAYEINHRAVEIAREAVGDQAYIGGSMGPTGQLLEPMGPLSQEEAEATYAEQARYLSDAGADLLVVETQFDLGEAGAAVRGARSVTSLPIVCSFSFDRGTRTMMGIRPAQMAKELEGWGVDVVGINCGRSLDENLKALGEVREATNLPVWFKPNAGIPRIDEFGNAVYSIAPEEMGERVAEWLDCGAQIVGGCCGTSPEHLTQIARAARTWIAQRPA